MQLPEELAQEVSTILMNEEREVLQLGSTTNLCKTKNPP